MANAHVQLLAFLQQGGSIVQQAVLASSIEANSIPFSCDFFTCALLALGSDDHEILRRAVAQWREAVAGLSAREALEAWLDTASGVLGRSSRELQKIQLGESAPRDARLLAMALLVLGKSVDPEVRFNVHCALVVFFSNGLWKHALAAHFSSLVVSGWERHVCVPATLRCLRVSVLQILSVSRDESTGWTKAARVLLAASSAVRSVLPAGVRERLVELAKAANAGA